MNNDLIQLAVKRGELKARIAMQRDALGQHIWPVKNLLGAGDRAVEGVHWLKGHPGAVVAAVAALVVVRPKRAWRLAKRAFVLYRGAISLTGRFAVLSDLLGGIQQRKPR